MSVFRKAFWIVFIPCILPVLPLFFHQSSVPWVGPYSLGYFAVLAVLPVFVFVISLAAASGCARKNSLRPAYSVLTGLLILAVSAGTADFALGFWYRDSFASYRFWGHKKSAIFGFEAAENYRWKAANAEYSTDAHGFRTHVPDPDWDKKEGLRIFVMGGSSVFGYGLNDDQTWAALLEPALKTAMGRKDLFVINAGNNGHNSLQTLMRFYLRVLPLKPEWVVYYENVNDIVQSVLMEKKTSDPIWIQDNVLFTSTMREYLALEKKRQNFYERTLIGYFLKQQIRRLHNSYLKRRYEKNPPAAEPLTPKLYELQEKNAARFEKNVRTLIQLARLNKVNIILTTFLYDSERMDLFSRSSIAKQNEILKRLAQEEKVPLVDLSAGFENVEDKAGYFYADHYHPNPKGAAYIAGELGKAMPEIMKAAQ